MPKITLNFSATTHGVDFGERGLDVYTDKELNSLDWALYAAKNELEKLIKRRVDKRIEEVDKLKVEAKK